MTTQRAFERFVQKVTFAGECWLWTGCNPIQGHRYGQFRDEFMRRVQSHRYSYEFFVGPIPQGHEIDHLCRNEACVNPRHLEPVTTQENTLRGLRPIPCIHGMRAISHCSICKKAIYNDCNRSRQRIIRGSTRANERHSEPHAMIGASVPQSIIESLNDRVRKDGTNRSSVIRKALTLYLSAQDAKPQT